MLFGRCNLALELVGIGEAAAAAAHSICASWLVCFSGEHSPMLAGGQCPAVGLDSLVWAFCRWMKGRDLSKVPGLSCRSGRFVPMAKKDGTPLQVTYQIKETEDENGQPGASRGHRPPFVPSCVWLLSAPY